MPEARDYAHLPLSDDAKFMLGEIAATVKHTALAVSDLRLEMMSNLSGFNTRLQELERAHAERVGSRNVFTTVIAVLSAMVSGILTYFVGRH